MRRGAGFDADQAGRQLREERQHLFSMQLLHEHGPAALVDAMRLEHALRQIEPDYRYRHRNAPVPVVGLSATTHSGTAVAGASTSS
jgi:hypothetical protein